MIDSSSGDQIVMSYYRKKKILGIHIPNTYGGTPTSALEEVAITMQAIAEHGVIPNKLSVLRYKKYKGNWEKLKESYSWRLWEIFGHIRAVFPLWLIEAVKGT